MCLKLLSHHLRCAGIRLIHLFIGDSSMSEKKVCRNNQTNESFVPLHQSQEPDSASWRLKRPLFGSYILSSLTDCFVATTLVVAPSRTTNPPLLCLWILIDSPSSVERIVERFWVKQTSTSSPSNSAVIGDEERLDFEPQWPDWHDDFFSPNENTTYVLLATFISTSHDSIRYGLLPSPRSSLRSLSNIGKTLFPSSSVGRIQWWPRNDITVALVARMICGRSHHLWIWLWLVFQLVEIRTALTPNFAPTNQRMPLVQPESHMVLPLPNQPKHDCQWLLGLSLNCHEPKR